MDSSSLKKKPKCHILDNGYKIPAAFVKEFEKSLTFVPDAGDVFICTYPKCGTTWTQCILNLMLSKGEPLKPGENINKLIPHLEDDGKDFVTNLPRPRVIKTHLPCCMLPKSTEAKYIIIARNPKDCCVSFYYHTKGFSKYYDFADGKFEDFFDVFLTGEFEYGDYFDHLLSYLAFKKEPNTLFLLYEDMKCDIKGSITKIGKFLGEPFSQSCEDPAILEKVIQHCSFKAMKSKPRIWSSEQDTGSAGFIRKGEIGDWRNHFTEEQARLLDEKFKAKLSGTEAEHFWDHYDC